MIVTELEFISLTGCRYHVTASHIKHIKRLLSTSMGRHLGYHRSERQVFHYYIYGFPIAFPIAGSIDPIQSEYIYVSPYDVPPSAT